MINLFDLSAGMASTKVLADQAHRDGSPVRRSRQDMERNDDPAKICVDDNLGANIRSSSSNKSNASPMKMLVSKEMSKEVESKRKPPGAVARLMGLEDDPPAQEPATYYAKRNTRRSPSMENLAAATRDLQQQEQLHHCKTTRGIHISPSETVEFKDVYAVCEEPFRTHQLQDRNFPRGRFSGDKRDIRLEVVQQKFMEAKGLATDENLLHTKEFQQALEVLSSNTDLFLKFLEEPKSVFSKQPNGHHTVPAPSQSKRITVLKPLKSVENKGVRKNRTNRVNEENDFVMGKIHQRSHSAEGTFSQPTKIVVLKPSPGKPSRTQAKLTPHAAPYQLTERTGPFEDLEGDASTQRYREVKHGLVRYLPEGRHQRDESLLSSVYSNGYGGDESSFGRSEADYIDEDGGSLTDSEVVSPLSRQSWDYMKRYNSPYSGSAYCSASHSHSPESSVIKEAKKRLSERWTTTAYNETTQEQVRLPRSSRTLGDMLSLQEPEKEEIADVINPVPSNRPCGTSNELAMQATFKPPLSKGENGESSGRNLERSKSLPMLSPVFHNIVVNAQSANSESCNSSMMERASKQKFSLKGKVSSFFFSRTKRLTKEKPSLPSDSSDDKIEVAFLGDMRSKIGNDLDINEQMACCKDIPDNSTVRTICSSKEPIPADCPNRYVDDLRSKGGLKCIHDHPSPTSVLDASFQYGNNIEPESSISSCNEIESIARSLLWEVTNSRLPLHGSLKFSNVEVDELECYALVRKIVSSAGLDNLQLSMGLTGWYLLDCPLDPSLCDKFLDRKEEAAKSRERRSNQKLIFDCVNMALVEVGQDTLLSTYPWSKECLGAWRELFSQPFGERVWSHVRHWLYGGGRFVANGNDDAVTMLERIMQQEVEGKSWIKSMRSEANEITKQIASVVLEEVVGEAVNDVSVCFS